MTPSFTDRGVRPVAAGRQTVRRPYVTYTLMAINIAVFVATVVQAGSANPDLSSIITHGELVRGSVFTGEYWRLFTAGFLHYGLLHIAVNMISLYILGRDLEVALGPARFLMVYVTSLFGGSAAVMLFQADLARSAGASGALFGLMGALLVVVLKLRVSPVPVMTIIALNLVLSFSLPGVSVPAHVGGLIFGAASAAAVIYLPGAILPPQRRTPERASAVGWIAMAVLLVVALGIGVGVGLAHTGPAWVYV
ncbi:rhomboid family intramembrane serine protease [Gordonia sinesedis]